MSRGLRVDRAISCVFSSRWSRFSATLATAGVMSSWRAAAVRLPLSATDTDGIALSSDGATLYYSSLSSRHLYSVPTALLRDRNADEATLAAALKDLGEEGASDGLEADENGVVYAGDYEHDSIRRRLPDGMWRSIAHDPRILWPDALSVGNDGYLYFTATQVRRQAMFHHGHDLRKKPYTLFRIKIDAKPVALDR